MAFERNGSTGGAADVGKGRQCRVIVGTRLPCPILVETHPGVTSEDCRQLCLVRSKRIRPRKLQCLQDSPLIRKGRCACGYLSMVNNTRLIETIEIRLLESES